MHNRRFLQLNQLFCLFAVFFLILVCYQRAHPAGGDKLRQERDEAVAARERAENELAAERHRSDEFQEQLRRRKK